MTFSMVIYQLHVFCKNFTMCFLFICKYIDLISDAKNVLIDKEIIVTNANIILHLSNKNDLVAA